MPGPPVEQTNSLIPESKTAFAGSGHRKISPRAKKTAGQLKINLSSLTGSGPEGRIIERDVIQKAGNQPKSTPLAKVMAFEKGVDLPPAGSGPGGKVLSTDLNLKFSVSDFQDIPLSNIRKIIARNMMISLQNTAQLTLHSSADATGLLDTRKKIKSLPESSEWKGITINDLVCFAVTQALIAHPEMNAHFLENSIRRFSVVHLGVAVDSTRGLMVPTLHSADRLGILDFSKKIKDLAQKCQSGSIDPELLGGATFTITNLGAFGIESFTPVLNPPQIGILGINNIRYFPGESAEGIFGYIPRVGLSLTFDHRAIDGAPAARFLQDVVKEIENLKLNISYA
jgi:pyruvate dehydrogenase E2 component (dihydrolipoamide acetyltransferase)